jgi:hypothetical protein
LGCSGRRAGQGSAGHGAATSGRERRPYTPQTGARRCQCRTREAALSAAAACPCRCPGRTARRLGAARRLAVLRLAHTLAVGAGQAVGWFARPLASMPPHPGPYACPRPAPLLQFLGHPACRARWPDPTSLPPSNHLQPPSNRPTNRPQPTVVPCFCRSWATLRAAPVGPTASNQPPFLQPPPTSTQPPN